ncbi:MAG: response regulator [Hoeflea sp.]|uniref:response regulator n=1 Tax=Hoeflea sp. TaxID=1940281 RepID=UPI0032EEB5DD
MDLSEAELSRAGRDGKIIEALALALDIAITFYDRNDRLIAASSQFRRFFDIPAELLVPGTRLRDLLGAAYDSGARSLGSIDGNTRVVSRDDFIAERIATHWRERHESIERLPDGRWIRLCKRRMPDGVLISTISDVSEQHRRDSELSHTRQQAELAQHILDNLANPVMVKDSSLRYVIVNEAYCRIPGVTAQRVIGRYAADLVGPELALRFETMERRVLETGIPYEAVEQIVRSDGSVMHTVTRARRSGTPGNYYVTVSFDDITEFVQADERQTDTPTPEEPVPQSAGTLQGRPERVLVLDSDPARAGGRVADLKAGGYDALAIGDAEEAMAFLGAAEAMQATVSRIEVFDPLAEDLSARDGIGRFPVLVAALEECRSKRVGNMVLPDVHATSELLPSRYSVRSSVERAATDPAPPRSEVPARPLAHDAPEQQTASRSADETKPSTGNDTSTPAIEQGRVRVLVAEDNSVNQIVFEQTLEGIGVDYRIVGNGEEAVAAWRASPPDLILMDISMPVMNGLQATQAIRDAESKDDSLRKCTPIIAVTAHAMSGDRDRCLQAGMDDYLSKPVSPDKLEAIISKWIGSPGVTTTPDGLVQFRQARAGSGSA